jgi:hypothetical protein
MGAFINVIDHIREKTGAAVLVVHHSGKDPNKGGRGHSSLYAAVDTEIKAKKINSAPEASEGAGIGRLKVTKQKDGRDNYTFEYAVEKVVILSGAEADFGTSGKKPRSSLAVRPLKEGESAGPQIVPLKQKWQDLLDIIVGITPAGKRFTVKQVNEAATTQGWHEAKPDGKMPPANTLAQRVRRALDGLVKAGCLDKVDGELELTPIERAKYLPNEESD